MCQAQDNSSPCASLWIHLCACKQQWFILYVWICICTEIYRNACIYAWMHICAYVLRYNGGGANTCEQIHVSKYMCLHMYMYPCVYKVYIMWAFIYVDGTYEELFSKTRSAPIQKLSFQCQCQLRRSCFGKELFKNMYMQTHMNTCENLFAKA